MPQHGAPQEAECTRQVAGLGAETGPRSLIRNRKPHLTTQDTMHAHTLSPFTTGGLQIPSAPVYTRPAWGRDVGLLWSCMVLQPFTKTTNRSPCTSTLVKHPDQAPGIIEQREDTNVT